MDVADNPNVGVCWNSQRHRTSKAEGLEYNFNLVKDRFGDTAHVRELDTADYPFQRLIDLFVSMDYPGWILLEGGHPPKDPVPALIHAAQDVYANGGQSAGVGVGVNAAEGRPGKEQRGCFQKGRDDFGKVLAR